MYINKVNITDLVITLDDLKIVMVSIFICDIINIHYLGLKLKS